MTNPLTPIATVEAYLKSPASLTAVVTALNDGLFDLLEQITGETFAAAGTVTDEGQNGTDRPWLYVNRPIVTVTTVKIGRDVTTPNTTLDGADVDEVVVDPINRRKIWRPNGLKWHGTTPFHGGPYTQFGRGRFSGTLGIPLATSGGTIPFQVGQANVFVTYEAAANLPDRAASALLDATAYTFRNLGKEDVKGFRAGGLTSTLVRSLSDVPLWEAYVSRAEVPAVL